VATDPLKPLREKAARGLSLTLDECKLFIASIRKSYLAAEAKVKTPKDGPKLSRDKKPVQTDIDFF